MSRTDFQKLALENLRKPNLLNLSKLDYFMVENGGFLGELIYTIKRSAYIWNIPGFSKLINTIKRGSQKTANNRPLGTLRNVDNSRPVKQANNRQLLRVKNMEKHGYFQLTQVNHPTCSTSDNANYRKLNKMVDFGRNILLKKVDILSASLPC